MARCAHCGVELPPDAHFCPSCGAPVSGDGPGDERKLATVLFADLVGSTALAGSQDPERTRALLDRFYDGMAEEIELAGGTVEKFVGDAVMAAFGAPAALEDHAERALHAALGMQRRLRALFGDRLALRIGVNTGEVVVGRPREGSSFVTGDAVNVGARLEQAAGSGEILVGERTAAAVRGAFELAEPVTVEAKGKPGGVVAQRLVRALSLMRPRGVGGLRTVFVGRDAELAQLREAYERVVADGRPRLLAIAGDAGVGKSRLLRELWGWLAEQEPQPLQRTGRCLSYGHGIAYWPLAEVLREHFDFRDDVGADVALERLGRFRYLGLTLGLDVAEGLHPLAARERLHDSWAEFLQEIAQERPTVVLIEDVHWAEDDLLDLLDSLAVQVEGPLLVLATARPELLERRPAWHRWALPLEGLRKATAGELLDGLVGVELPSHLRGAIVDRAEGNPFFVEELLATLIDRGVLQRQNGGWTYAEVPEGFQVPDTVQAVLAARIDLLPAAEKAALQAAAVIGRVFWTGPVYELVGGAPNFDLLTERDFVRRRAGSSLSGEREYAIKHALTREVAYASLPRARRARMHAAFAAWLEQRAKARDDLASLLAHHYAEAVRPEETDLAWAGEAAELERLRAKALLWLEAAAQFAMRRYEILDAIALLERALSLRPDAETEARLWRAVGKANALRFEGEAFWTAMQNSLKVCANRATCADTYSELAFQTAIRSSMWAKRPDRALVSGWIQQALDLSEPKSMSRAKALIARSFWDRNTPEAAREGSELAEHSGDVELLSYAWGARGAVAFGMGDFESALTWSQRRLSIVPQISDPDHLADIYEIAIPSCCASAQFDEARRLAAEHNAVVEPLSAHHRVHGVAVLLEVEEACGGWNRILELAERTESAVAANLATPCIRNARSLLVTALAAAYAGDDQTARRYERRANEVATEGYDFALAAPRIWLALLRNEIGNAKGLEPADLTRGQTWYALPAAAARLDALAALKERSLVERDAPAFLRPGIYLEPFAMRALGVVREDETLVEQAAQAFDAMGLAWHAQRTREHQIIH